MLISRCFSNLLDLVCTIGLVIVGVIEAAGPMARFAPLVVLTLLCEYVWVPVPLMQFGFVGWLGGGGFLLSEPRSARYSFC